MHGICPQLFPVRAVFRFIAPISGRALSVDLDEDGQRAEMPFLKGWGRVKGRGLVLTCLIVRDPPASGRDEIEGGERPTLLWSAPSPLGAGFGLPITL